jgi:hypothetical protein
MATADELVARVMNGATWLGEHDPKGVFYLWHEAGIRPGAPLPALTDPIHPGYIEGRAEKYAEWCKQYALWQNLYAALEIAAGEEARG